MDRASVSQHPIDPRLVKKEPTTQVETPKVSLKDPRGPRMASDAVRSDAQGNGNTGGGGGPENLTAGQSLGDKVKREEGYQVAAADPQSRDHKPPSAYQVARDSDISGGAPVGEQRTAPNLLPQQSSFGAPQPQQPTRVINQEPAGTNLVPTTNSAGAMPSGHQNNSGSKIFVGGLSWETQEASLRRYFETFGEVLDCVIMRDRHTGHPRGFGFVTFADDAVAERAAARRHDLDGRQVEAKRAVPRNEFSAGSGVGGGASQQQGGAMGGAGYARAGAAGGQDPRYGGAGANQGAAAGGYAMSSAAMRQHHTTRGKVFVGGLPSSCGNEEFKQYFQQYGEVVDAQVMIDHNTGNSRGFGFVTFGNEGTVETVVGPGRSNTRHEIMGKNVEVKRAEPKGMSNSSRRHDAYGSGGGGGAGVAGGMRSGGAGGAGAGSNSSNLGGAGDAGSNAAAAAAYYNNYATASLAEQYGAYYNNPQWQQYYAAMGYNFNAYPQGYNPYNYLSAYMQNVANGSNPAAGAAAGMPTSDAAAAAAAAAGTAGAMPGAADVQGTGYDGGRGAAAGANVARYDGGGANPSGGNGTGGGPSSGSSGGARRSSRRDERYHPYR